MASPRRLPRRRWFCAPTWRGSHRTQRCTRRERLTRGPLPCRAHRPHKPDVVPRRRLPNRQARAVDAAADAAARALHSRTRHAIFPMDQRAGAGCTAGALAARRNRARLMRRSAAAASSSSPAAPTSLPTRSPPPSRASPRRDRATINATDSEDALKYLPSLLVRKRYIGDYNHAVLSTPRLGHRQQRALDGLCRRHPAVQLPRQRRRFTPRWGLVTPEEIERVDVLYGPFSAAYPGNSVGGGGRLRDAHADGSSRRTPSSAPSRSPSTCTARRHLRRLAGQRLGRQHAPAASSWWFNVNRLDSDGQPLTFATKVVAPARHRGPARRSPAPSPGRTAATRTGTCSAPRTQYDTVQDHAKAKLAYDFSRRCAPATPSAGGTTTPQASREPTCAMRPATRSTAARPPSTAATTRLPPPTSRQRATS